MKPVDIEIPSPMKTLGAPAEIEVKNQADKIENVKNIV